MDGYKVAAKTGTSQKFDILDENGNSYLRIGSTVAFAPSDKSGIAVIIVVDEPTSAVKYGSFVAAPYISAFLEKALPYLSYESELETKNTEVQNYVGLSIETAKKKLDDEKIRYQIVGDGNTVIAQTPEGGNFTSSELTTIILYTETPNDFVTVPSLLGLEASEAAKLLINSGLNVCIGGSYDSGHVVWQSLPTGARVKRGTAVKITVLISDFEG